MINLSKDGLAALRLVASTCGKVQLTEYIHRVSAKNDAEVTDA